jgi:hypothetical protein
VPNPRNKGVKVLFLLVTAIDAQRRVLRAAIPFVRQGQIVLLILRERHQGRDCVTMDAKFLVYRSFSFAACPDTKEVIRGVELTLAIAYVYSYA